jgi:hypothetical protein
VIFGATAMIPAAQSVGFFVEIGLWSQGCCSQSGLTVVQSKIADTMSWKNSLRF